MYDWEASIINFREDISEYLKKRYEDYCKDIKEKENLLYLRDEVRKRHEIKQDELIKLGINLRKKLGFFLDEPRKELFKQHISELKNLEDYFKDKYNKFCEELEETNNFLSLQDHKNSYQLYIEKDEKEKQLFKFKEYAKDTRFIKIIDLRRHNYERRVVKEEKRKVKEEKRKAKKERVERRQGRSNIKPLTFYEELFNSGDIEYDNEEIKEEQIYDIYFQKNGKPMGVWETYRTRDYDEKKKWVGDESFSDEEVDKYVLSDILDKNQIYLNRCKEQLDFVVVKEETDAEYYLKNVTPQIEILQRYLSKKHLITRQIAFLNRDLVYIMREACSTNPNYPYHTIKNHPSRKYNFSVYNDIYDILKIKEDVSEFIRKNEGLILTPIEYLGVYLKKHNNQITIKEYSKLIKKSEYIASKRLNGFVVNKELKAKQVDSSHKFIYYI